MISKKRMGLLAGVLIGSMIAVMPVQASSILDEVTGTETTEDFAEDTNSILTRSNHLGLGKMKISKLASNKINIYGLTQCHHECDKAYLEIYLEQKVGNSYGTYKYWEFDASNVTSLEKSINVIVPSGHYYRVRGYHAAKEGTTKESTTTLTSGVLVN